MQMSAERERILNAVRDELRQNFHASDDPIVADVTAYILGVRQHPYLRATRTPPSRRGLGDHIDAEIGPLYLPHIEELLVDASAHQLREVIRGIARSIDPRGV